jgi:hypothetical protein
VKRDPFALTLFDMKDELNWVRQLRWSDEELQSVPVHEQATSGDDYLNMANFGGTALGVSAKSGGGTSAGVRNVRNLYIYRHETPSHLYEQLKTLLDRGGPSGYEDGEFGERGERDSFPPR